jgi:hypothetical protein
MSTVRRILLGVLAVTFVGGAITVTSAVFSAQTRNPGNVFATGSLVLSNTKAAGVACYSTAGGSTDTNVNNACDQLVNLTVKKPGDSGTARLSVSNVGTINSTSLGLYAGTCATTDAAGTSYHGTGNVCTKALVYVQQYTDGTYTTPSVCAYGGGDGTTCDFTDAAKTLAALNTLYNSGSPADLGALTAGSVRYYEVGISLASNADNTYQGRSAAFDLTWTLAQ